MGINSHIKIYISIDVLAITLEGNNRTPSNTQYFDDVVEDMMHSNYIIL